MNGHVFPGLQYVTPDLPMIVHARDGGARFGGTREGH